MANGFQAKILICVECGEEFIFTVGAQEYFAERGYTEEPRRCKHCHMKYKRDRKNGIKEGLDTIPPDITSEGFSARDTG